MSQNPDLLYLAILGLFMLFAWAPSSYGKYKHKGVKWLASNRGGFSQDDLPDWTGRAERAYRNLGDYFPSFAVAVISTQLLNINSDLTLRLTQVFVLMRIVHYVSYCMGNVKVRATAWSVAIICHTILFINIINYFI